MMRRKEKALCISAFIFVGLYFLSKTSFRGLYLFEWTARHSYLCLWAVAILLICFGKIRLSLLITIGNVIGVFVGQYGGDLLKNINMQKIEANMDAGKVYQLRQHHGVTIWILTIVIFIMIYMAVNLALKKKSADHCKE